MAEDTTAGGEGGLGPNQLAGSMDKLDESTRNLSTGANAFAKAISSAFAQGVTGAKSFDLVLKSLALRLSDLSLNLALKPLTNALAGNLTACSARCRARPAAGRSILGASQTAMRSRSRLAA